jgi:hypothetical protein
MKSFLDVPAPAAPVVPPGGPDASAVAFAEPICVNHPEEVQRSVVTCPWIAPCSICGAAVQVTIESVDRDPGLSVKVDYACERKHRFGGYL